MEKMAWREAFIWYPWVSWKLNDNLSSCDSGGWIVLPVDTMGEIACDYVGRNDLVSTYLLYLAPVDHA